MFLVMRTHTLKQRSRPVLWQVASQPFSTKEEAEGWQTFLEEEYLEESPRGKHKFFVVETSFKGTVP